MTLHFNAALSRYEQLVNGHPVFAAVKHEGSTLHILHVEAAPELRGTGAAGAFMQALMEQVKAEGVSQIVPVCGYAAAWMKRHTR